MSVWFWVTLWAVLVTATVIGAILLARWLWRAFRALMSELDRAEELHGPAMIRLDAALNAAEERPRPDGADSEPHRPSMFADDLTTHYARLAVLREARTARRAARRARQRVTWEKWRHFNDPHAHDDDAR
ncbi:hypothetical protein [Myceligenerans pegani]|uniref:Uncharacterized protein n=1 Tax=Myceligenerans pegani TaxID=2776917 RepID=A0ABR9MU71_9MICO|nr:hypothetical protein [Myceligenerans sp. TRM 65318]MBE1874918.1 hypothetical protein [Myceligenerans sp. TRM 65318]MBE3017189.1 hypothetical protein [Myceligenerans sp. TRM 65318]